MSLISNHDTLALNREGLALNHDTLISNRHGLILKYEGLAFFFDTFGKNRPKMKKKPDL
jgi:hypothetical protein